MNIDAAADDENGDINNTFDAHKLWNEFITMNAEFYERKWNLISIFTPSNLCAPHILLPTELKSTSCHSCEWLTHTLRMYRKHIRIEQILERLSSTHCSTNSIDLFGERVSDIYAHSTT